MYRHHAIPNNWVGLDHLHYFDGFYLHDPVAVGYLEHPGFFDTVPAYVQVETTSGLTRGRTVADLRSSNIDGPEPNAQVCVGINTGQFLDYFLDRIFASA